MFYFDGQPKYQLQLGAANSNGLVPAKGVRYLPQKWCVMSQDASLDNPEVAPSVSYACANADCTSLGYGTSCSNLDPKQNISYAYNDYYQQNDQLETACKFPNGLSTVVAQDPSVGECRFRVMIQMDPETWSSESDSTYSINHAPLGSAISIFVVFVLMLI
ncbi:unnamed protein product [Linum tenue]|nr:unnamed protein product [Linum tenue]